MSSERRLQGEPVTTPSEGEGDDVVRERLLRDPEIRKRLEDGLAALHRGETPASAVTRERLQDLLRDSE